MGVKGVVDDKERSRLVFTIFLLADALVTSNFTALHVLSDPNMWTLELNIISWVFYIGILIAVNIWLYYAYLKKPQSQARSVSP
jgi:hypothetical protein